MLVTSTETFAIRSLGFTLGIVLISSCVAPEQEAKEHGREFVPSPLSRTPTQLATGASYAVGQAFLYSFDAWGVAAEIGDVTGDGRPDVVVATSTYGSELLLSVLLFKQNVDGTLALPVTAPYIPNGVSYPGGSPWGTGLVLTDLDNDGVSDIAVGHKLGVSVFRGGQPLQSPTLLPASISPVPRAMSLFPSDVNRDGNMDLISSCVYGGGCSAGPATIWFGDGALGLASMKTVEVINIYPTIDVGDLTGDGNPDLLSASYSGMQILFHLYAHDGVGGFEDTPTTFEVPKAGHYRTIGDVNGDGLNDIVSVSGVSAPVAMYVEQTPLGTLGPPQEPFLFDTPDVNAVKLADMDDDGINDVVVVHGGGWGTASVLIGGQLPIIHGAIGGSTQYSDGALAIGDFSSDGCGDIALADMNYGFFFALGQCPPDPDNDGLRNHLDNCDDVANIGQVDSDGDGAGDACDVCIDILDPQQQDTDEDGSGDLCDPDQDNDGIVNELELQNGMDPKSVDSDSDTIADLEEFLPGQPTDTDGDGDLDANDIDSDNDTLPDNVEAGDGDLGTPAIDTDADGIPDFRDLDSDNDMILDRNDVCPLDSANECAAQPDAGVADTLDSGLPVTPSNSDDSGCRVATSQSASALWLLALWGLCCLRRRSRSYAAKR